MRANHRTMLMADGPSTDWPWAVVMGDGFTAGDFLEITLWCGRELGDRSMAWDLHGNGWVFKHRDSATRTCLTWG